MQEWFNIPTLVKRPQEFFAEYTELYAQLVKTGYTMDFFEAGDITEKFIDGLINYEKDPSKINPSLEKIHQRELIKIQVRVEALNEAQKKHKSKP